MGRSVDPRTIEILDDMSVQILQRMTPEQRGAIAAQMHETGRAILRTQIESRHPEWSAAEVQAELARRWSRDSD
jgi:hypothetical protein